MIVERIAHRGTGHEKALRVVGIGVHEANGGHGEQLSPDASDLQGTAKSERPGRGSPARAAKGSALLPEAEGVHLVVVGWSGEAFRAAVAGAPVDAAGDDRGAAGYRAAAGEAPQDFPGRGVKGVHVGAGGGHRSAVDDAV